MNGQKIDFLRFSKPGNKYFFPCKTKHRPYVTLANFPIKDPARRDFFVTHHASNDDTPQSLTG
jgi:hypothetical protein